MRRCKIFLTLALLAPSVACIHQRTYSGIDAVIEPRDLTAPVELTGCDAKSFPQGSERLIVTKATAK